MDRTALTVAEDAAPVEPARKPATRKRTPKPPATPPASETAPAQTPATEAPPTTETPAAEPARAGWTDAEHAMLDARGFHSHRGARAMLYREFKRTGLDPFAGHLYLRQDFVYLTVQNDLGNWIDRKTPVYTVCAKIAGLRTVARNQPDYRGQTSPKWFGRDGSPRHVWTPEEAPVGCVVGVRVAGYDEPMVGVALYREFKPANAGAKSSWVRMPSHMVRIAAESQALRMAYPDLLSDVYTDEEMAQARADMENAALSGVPHDSFVFGEPTDRPAEAPPGAEPAAAEGAPAPAAPAMAAGLARVAKAAEALAYLREHPGHYDGVYADCERLGILGERLADEGGVTLAEAMAAYWVAHVADVAERDAAAVPAIRDTAGRRGLLGAVVPGDDGARLSDVLDRAEAGVMTDYTAPATAAEVLMADAAEPPADFWPAADEDPWHVPGNSGTRPGPDPERETLICAVCQVADITRTPTTFVAGRRACPDCADEALADMAPPF